MNAAQSLVLITVDCMRADHAGFLGYDRNTTPFLDSLAATSIVFSNAIVAGAPTYYSLPAIMSSRPPLALGRDVIGIAPEEPTIASTLRQLGYATGAFLAANPYLSPRFGYNAGFDTFRDFLDTEVDSSSNSASLNGRPLLSRLNEYLAKTCHNLGPIGSIYDDLYFEYCQRAVKNADISFDSLRRFPSASVLVDQASLWLDGLSGTSFFLWLHFMDPHSPYFPQQETLQSLGTTLDASRARYLNSYWNRGDIGPNRLTRHREEIVSLYDAGIHSADSQIGRFVDELQRRRLWENCIVAVTADHGEEFLEHGGRYHSPSKLTEELIHVPLLVAGGKPVGPSVRKEPVSLVDLAPTLFDAIGVPSLDTFLGRSFLTPPQDADGSSHAAIVESVGTCMNPFDSSQRLGPRLLAIREADYKLVINFGSSQEDLFDLKNDPGELHPLRPEVERPVRHRMLKRASEHLAQSVESRNPALRLDAQLRDLRLEWSDSVGSISS
jgi:arylsulfatase A-like enzyme